MADKDQKSSPDTPASPAQGPKRPHATLDLKATEIKVTPISGAAASASSTATSSPGPAPASSYAATDRSSASSDAKTKPSDSSSASKPAAASPPADRAAGTRGATLTHLTAGLVGGALALVGAEFVRPHTGGGEASALLSQRLGALEKTTASRSLAEETERRVGELEKSASAIADLKDAQSRLVAETKAALAAAASDAGAPEQLTRLAAVEDRLKALADAGANDPNAGRIPQLAALTGKVADLETALATQLAELRKSVAADVDGRLQSATEASEAARSGAQRIDRDVAGVKGDAIRIEERIVALKSDVDRAAATAKMAQDEAAAIRSDIGAIKSQSVQSGELATALAPLTERIAQLDSLAKALSKAEDGRRADAERVVLALELQNLKRALDAGRPFSDELASVDKMAGGSLDLGALEPFKSTGVPPATDLAKEFRPVAYAAIDAEAAPIEGGVVDRLIAGARSVVRVRKTDHQPDDRSVEAIVGRIETALRQARLDDALNEAKALPPKAQAAAKPFLDRIAARIAVDNAVDTLEAQLKSSLGSAQPASVKPQ